MNTDPLKVKLAPGALFSTRDPDTDVIILCALRYAFTRRSYMPSLVQDYITRHWHEIGTRRTIIIQDIRDHIRESEQFGTYNKEDTYILESWKQTLTTLERKDK